MSHPPHPARPSQPRHRGEPRHRFRGRTLAVAAVCVLTFTSTSAGFATGDTGRDRSTVPGWTSWSGLSTAPGASAHHRAGRAATHDEDATDTEGESSTDPDTDQDAGLVTSGPSLDTSVDPSRNALAMSTMGATPAPLTPYEMPFPCGQTWTGSTRPDHTPSPRAIDWNAPGDLGMPVVAAAAGTVTTARTGVNLASYGQYVVIDHGNGESTLYGHLDSVTVAVGQVVPAGQQIGTLGSTGHSSGPHLHFEERLNGVDQDVWLHGAPYPIGIAAISANCGTTTGTTTPTTPTTTTTATPVVTRLVPMAGNMFGARAQAVVYHKRAYSWFGILRNGKATKKVKMGNAGDQPVLGDWDGNGRVNPGVRRPSSRLFYLRVHGHDQTIRLGHAGDLPIAGNWDGVGGWEVGIRKAHSGVFKLRADDGTITRVQLGDAGDIPVTGDWNGDGVTDLGAYDSATSVFTLATLDATGAVVQQTQVAYGVPGDYPVAGDWNGDGTGDVGVWDPRTREFSKAGVSSTVLARTAG